MKPAILFIFVAFSFFAMLLIGCSDSAKECEHIEEHGEVVAEISEQSTILLYNNTQCTVRYFAGDSEVLSRISPGPHQSFDSWPTIPAGEVKEIPFGMISYYSTDTRFVSIFWNYINKSPGSSIPIWITLYESEGDSAAAAAAAAGFSKQ